MSRIDRSNINVKRDQFKFVPLRPTVDHEVILAQAGFAGRTELIVFKRGNERRALLAREMMYHHIGQGFLAGEPYLVTF